MDTKSGPSPLVWIVAVVAMVALAYFGWQSNQKRPTAAPTASPAEAQQESAPQQEQPAPMPQGALAG